MCPIPPDRERDQPSASSATVSSGVAPDLEVLISGVLAANRALNIDMGDGERTYQCCNAVCGHPPGCVFGRAFQHLIEAGLIDWDCHREWHRALPKGGAAL